MSGRRRGKGLRRNFILNNQDQRLRGEGEPDRGTCRGERLHFLPPWSVRLFAQGYLSVVEAHGAEEPALCFATHLQQRLWWPNGKEIEKTHMNFQKHEWKHNEPHRTHTQHLHNHQQRHQRRSCTAEAAAAAEANVF